MSSYIGQVVLSGLNSAEEELPSIIIVYFQQLEMQVSLNLYNSSRECHSFSSVAPKNYTTELFNLI